MNPEANRLVVDYSTFDPRVDFRSQFALTFVFALGTAFFWLMQFVFPDNLTYSIFAGLAGLLSILARISILVSFITRSANWLAMSAIASTSSGLLAILGSLPFGGYQGGLVTDATWFFSMATLVTYFIQARKAGLKPYAIVRQNR